MPDLRKPAHQPARQRRRPRCANRPAGFALHETLCALIVLGAGLMPIMGLAPKALAQLRELDALAQAARLAVEMAELDAAQPALQSGRPDLWSSRCGNIPAFPCPENSRLIMAGRLGGQDGIPAIALWMQP
ncbi:Type II secretory pathway, pseudopilin PulG [Cupriavidus necator]|uniref:Type II secretory pathway, pseudopilin PulG n=1 Tax=Cupriavidus necator TaxID=106590 RepID=A0A1K0J7T5_CUPNE|nr:Type II secretory pathway, pseudopilin PulG [Cupriavidus necator]